MEIRQPNKHTAFVEWLQKKIDEKICSGQYKTNRELAEAADICPSTLSSYGSGRFFPGKERLQRLANVLGVEPNDIEKFRYQLANEDPEYVLRESELEELVQRRFGQYLDSVTEAVAIHLHPTYEDIGRSLLQEIQDQNKELRRRYN